MKTTNAGQTSRTVTRVLHLPHNPETSAKLHRLARQQDAVYNLVIAEQARHGQQPLLHSTRKNQRGLRGRVLQLRDSREPWLANIQSAIHRPATRCAKAAFDAWEKTNAQHARETVKALDHGRKTPKNDAGRANPPRGRRDDATLRFEAESWDGGTVPRHVQHRRVDPKTLHRRRKEIERGRLHRLTIDQPPAATAARTLKVPGVGTITTREKLDLQADYRSCTFVERQDGLPPGKGLRPEERRWNVHVQTRVPAPLRPLSKSPGEPTSIGIDHGVVHAMTSSASDGAVTFHDQPAATAAAEKRHAKAQRRIRKTRRGSRRNTRARKAKTNAKAKAIRRRDHWQRATANAIADAYDVVAIERLRHGNMRRSARGTAERPGSNVTAKTGLARSLARVSPGRQTAELMEAAARRGATYCLVNGSGTSITCASCTHKDKRSRETQAGFRCVACGHESNADANAAENIRRRALATLGVGVDRSPAR